MRVVSAHRTPDLLFRYAETAADRGIRVIIAGAGRPHLPGMLAAQDGAAGDRRARPRPSTSAASTTCSRSSADAARDPRRRRSGHRQCRGHAALLAAQILGLSDPDVAARIVRAARGPRAESVLGRPIQRGAAPGLTAVAPPARVPAARRPARVDFARDGRRTLGAGHAGPRSAAHARTGGRPQPAAEPPGPPAAQRARDRPDPPPEALRPPVRPGAHRGRDRDLTALEIGSGADSPLVKLCVLIAAPLLLVTTLDATIRIWRSAWAWMPVDRGKGLPPARVGRW